MMTRTFFRRLELEPPAWFYVLMARGPLFRRVYRRFVADLAAGVPQEAHLLDVGTGPGYLLAYLARQRPDLRLFGLDLSHRMVAGGRRRLAQLAPEARINGLVGNSQALPVRSESFEQVTSTFSFHIWQEPAQAVTEMVRILKPGGRAWIYEMNRDADRSHIREFAREEHFPFPFVYLGFHSLAWNHALRSEEFTAVFQQAGISSWNLARVHHIFWRLEIRRKVDLSRE
ncbi:MAG: class I SAM-dependent methyltransferase [Deltaproteobacteria bacterium]|nr:class I SAM-dependent methyltransferase [Deltaproteobacteria bacterium]